MNVQTATPHTYVPADVNAPFDAYAVAYATPVPAVGARVSWTVTHMDTSGMTRSSVAFGTVVGHEEPYATATRPRWTVYVVADNNERRTPFAFGPDELTYVPAPVVRNVHGGTVVRWNRGVVEAFTSSAPRSAVPFDSVADAVAYCNDVAALYAPAA